MTKVLVINDLSCVGRCSLTVALPVISAFGAQAVPLPTAILSTQTGGVNGYTYLPLTAECERIVAHWHSLKLKFDVIYCGYLPDLKLFAVAKRIFKNLLKPDGKIIIDPIMADNGSYYANFDKTICEAMRELTPLADIIIPNLTEAYLLADLPFADGVFSEELRQKLSSLCRNFLVTGISTDHNTMKNVLSVDGKSFERENEKINKVFHGAGDVFSSVFVGAVAKNHNFEQAFDISHDFTAKCILSTAANNTQTTLGLDFEQNLVSINS